MKTFLFNAQHLFFVAIYTALLTIGLVGCSGMTPKAQIKVSLQEIEWRGKNNQFDQNQAVFLIDLVINQPYSNFAEFCLRMYW